MLPSSFKMYIDFRTNFRWAKRLAEFKNVNWTVYKYHSHYSVDFNSETWIRRRRRTTYMLGWVGSKPNPSNFLDGPSQPVVIFLNPRQFLPGSSNLTRTFRDTKPPIKLKYLDPKWTWSQNSITWGKIQEPNPSKIKKPETQPERWKFDPTYPYIYVNNKTTVKEDRCLNAYLPFCSFEILSVRWTLQVSLFVCIVYSHCTVNAWQ